MSPTPQHAGQSFETGASPIEVHHGADTAAATASMISSSPLYEDYDLDNLEMPISATTSLDYEDISGCDSLDMGDVMSVRDTRRVWDADHDGGGEEYPATRFASGAGPDVLEWCSDGIEEEGRGCDGFVEIEEDWELLHEQVHASDGGDDAQAEEDGDVVIDW